jgi:hypothetical protein
MCTNIIDRTKPKRHQSGDRWQAGKRKRLVVARTAKRATTGLSVVTLFKQAVLYSGAERKRKQVSKTGDGGRSKF